MAHYNLDIERYYLQEKELGYELKAIAVINYPIYCIHSIILDSTPDPLKKLDKAIFKCILMKKNIKDDQIAKILCVNRAAVKLRLGRLEQEGLLKKKNTIYEPIEDAEEIIVNGKSRRQQRLSYDFYIDGIDFQPLKRELYGNRYKSSFDGEHDYFYYTNKLGKEVIIRPFRPNIVHEPLSKDRIIETIFSVSAENRNEYAIPIGLQEIDNVDFTKMTIPVLVSLLAKEDQLKRRIIDGFSILGENQNISEICDKLIEKIEKIELRIDVINKNDKRKAVFTSNWNEVDIKNQENRLQFLSLEDVRMALEENYEFTGMQIENLFLNKHEIKLNVTKALLEKAKSKKKMLIKNLKRGRDYINCYGKHGIWLVFVSFTTDCAFIHNLLRISEILEKAQTENNPLDKKIKEIIDFPDYRKSLLTLDEYELLEIIDIKKYMYTIEY